jgi:5-methyltetrahydropteroyltriglutamate--homocysteine methyltransferase
MSAPYRADHVGSFLRPPELLEARRTAAQDPQRVHAIEDRDIERVLAKQKELGFDIFTDGEFRRRNFMSDFTDAVDGFDLGDAVARSWKAGQEKDAPVSSVTGIVTRKFSAVEPLTGRELPFVKKQSPGNIKMTLPSATQFPAISFKRGVTDKIYKDHSELLWDIVAIMKTELARLSAEGVKYIQIDAPRYSYFMDPRWREWIRTEMNVAPDALLDESIRADNACFAAARRPGVTLAIHLCRGNNRSHWYVEGGYDAIARALTGGTYEGNFYQPTVVADVTPNMAAFRDELFGSVAAVTRADNADHALANNFSYGLSSAVLTNDLQLAMRFALELEAGMVHLNRPTVHDEPTVPFGSVKDSGSGREGGRWSVEEMTEVKWVTIQMGRRHYPS